MSWQRVLIEGGIISVLVSFIVSLIILWVKNCLTKKIERLRHEFTFSKATYEQHLGHILDYYDKFYQDYRLCQKVAKVDAIKQPDGKEIRTIDIYRNKIDDRIGEWNKIEAKIRILLPEKILKIHEKSIRCFNNFNKVVKSHNFYNAEFKAELEKAEV